MKILLLNWFWLTFGVHILGSKFQKFCRIRGMIFSLSNVLVIFWKVQIYLSLFRYWVSFLWFSRLSDQWELRFMFRVCYWVITSSIIDLHTWVICMASQMNLEGLFAVLGVVWYFWCYTSHSCGGPSILWSSHAFVKVNSQKRYWPFWVGLLKRTRTCFSECCLSEAWFAKARPPFLRDLLN